MNLSTRKISFRTIIYHTSYIFQFSETSPNQQSNYIYDYDKQPRERASRVVDQQTRYKLLSLSHNIGRLNRALIQPSSTQYTSRSMCTIYIVRVITNNRMMYTRSLTTHIYIYVYIQSLFSSTSASGG